MGDRAGKTLAVTAQPPTLILVPKVRASGVEACILGAVFKVCFAGWKGLG